MSENDLSIIGKALEWSYEQAVSGSSFLGTAQKLGDEYLKANNYDKLSAINSLIRWQNTKAATGGFVTNLGGVVTLPVSIPANLASSLYIQLRMIAAIAHICDYDVEDDRVKTLCFVCLTGNNAADILKAVGIEFCTKFTAEFIQKYITKELMKSINKAVGFRLLTRTGTAGLLNLTKIVPIVGGVVAGTLDGISTNTVGNIARDAFMS